MVNREQIGAIGICGSGGFALSATQMDTRIKAVATASMYDMTLASRLGMDKETVQATKEKLSVGTVEKYFAKAGVAEIHLNSGAVAIGDEIKIIGRTTGVYSATVTEMRDVNQVPIERAEKGDIITIPVSRRMRLKDQVYLWQDR